MRIRTTVVLLTAALFAACSSSDNSDEGAAEDMETGLPTQEGDSDQTSMPAPGTDPSDAPQALSRYNGNYLVACSLDDEAEEELWDTIEITIQDDVGTSIVSEYSDADCTQPTTVATITYSFFFPGGTVNTPLGVADFLDVTLESVTVDGVAVNFPGPEVEYDLILLDGNNLYSGLSTEELDGESPENRPIEIDQTEIATRL